MVQWYYAQGGQQVGPVDQAAIRQLLASGQIQPGDLVWNEGMTNWQPAATIPELAVAPAPTPIPQDQTAVPYAPLPQPGAAPPGPAPYAPFQQPPAPGFAVAPLAYGGGTTAPKSYQGLAIGGFITAMFGLPCIPCVSYIAAPVGLILCIIALSGMKSSGNPSGKGLAIAGIICSAIYIVIIIVGASFFALASRHP